MNTNINSSNNYNGNNRQMLSAFHQNTIYNTTSSNNSSEANHNKSKLITNLNDKKELIEINNRLGSYINSVKDLSENIQFGNSLDYNKSNYNGRQAPSTTNTLLVSMKNLENDLDTLKKLYENEFKLMRMEIEDLSSYKNKYSLENYNLEAKLKDFIVKFEDVKKTNQEILQELNQVKARNNKIEFELESARLDAEKPIRENKQLRKDLDDILEKLNEKQSISDNEIAYRQDLETKYKELSDLSEFEKKVHQQEIENLKSQLKVAHEAINSLEMKLNMFNENKHTNEIREKDFKKFENENLMLKSRNKQLEEQNESLKSTCANLEQVIANLEEIKLTLEERIASKTNQESDNSSSLKSLIKKTKFDTSNIDQQRQSSLASSRNIQSRISFNHHLQMNDDVKENNATQQGGVYFEENTNTLNSNSKQNSRPVSSFGSSYLQNSAVQQQLRFAEKTEFINETNNEAEVENCNENSGAETTNRFVVFSPRATQNNTSQNNTSQSNAFIKFSMEQQRIDKQNQLLSQQRKKIITQSDNDQQANGKPTITNRQTAQMFLPNGSGSSPHIFSPPSSTSSMNYSPHSQQNKTSQPPNQFVRRDSNYEINKDFTNDLFKNFEKNTFTNFSTNSFNSKRDVKLNSNSQISTIDNHVTEASYTGNVKIHEVNKNGYYIRLLNVSNTLEEDLSNYTIQQTVSSMPVAIFRLPAATKLLPGHTITIWSRTDEVEQHPPHTFVWNDQDKWGTGPECTTILSKPNGQAVSWTTGCHKYGNIDYDEIVPVYSQRRSKTPIQLNREKLVPQTLFSPTKHPHGAAAAVSVRPSTADTNHLFKHLQEQNPNTTANNQQVISMASIGSSSKNIDNSAFQKSLFSTQRSRPVNSSSTNSINTNNNNNTSSNKNTNGTRPKTSISDSKIKRMNSTVSSLSNKNSSKKTNGYYDDEDAIINDDVTYQENYYFVPKINSNINNL